MAKPICVIYIPEEEGLTIRDRFELVTELDRNKPDYHWFAIESKTLKDISFDVFHEKDFKDTEELRKIINEYTSK